MRLNDRSKAPVRSALALVRCLLLAALALPVASAHAQGKISGTVVDAQTRESLIGVSVVLDGTTQGTVTDTDGNYVLLNVRPGEYTVNFSYVGYQTKQVAQVRVTTGQTTNLDVELGEQVLEGEEVVVIADRPLVQKDLTASRRTVVSDEIEALPVESFQDVLLMQAGVSQGADGALHIRGGRSNEVSYLVDGMSVSNPFETNGLATEVAVDAIQEMTVISGAFNAEYGKAMSGIVNLVTKEGDDTYSGSISAYAGDRLTSNSDIFWTPSGVGVNDYTLEASLGGPVPLLKGLRFYVAGRRDVDEGYIYGTRRFQPGDSVNFNGGAEVLEAIREHIPDYSGPAWYYEIAGRPWYTYGSEADLPGERVSMNSRSSYNALGKLTLRPFRGAKIEYSYMRDQAERTPFVFAYRYNPDGVATETDWSNNHSLHWTHTLNDRIFYTLRGSYASNAFRDYLYENPTDPRYVSTGAILGFPEGTNFNFGGDQKEHVTEDARSARAKFDLTRQFGVIHETKVGFDVAHHWLDREYINILYNGNDFRVPTVPPVTSPAHDVYEDQQVTELAAYAQDKLEFRDFIINVGLRFERFVPRGQYVVSLLDPRGEREESTPKNMVLPRLGVSFPITERGIIHFSYGHFAQMPSLRRMYTNPEFDFEQGTPLLGNSNIRPERTVQYEVGLQQQIGEQLAFDVTGYFKDVRDYLTTQTVRHSTIEPGQYRIYLNKNYAHVRGITFALTKRREPNGLLSAGIDYTYQIAEGNNDDTDAFFFNILAGREDELEVVPLEFDQRHILSANVTLTRPRNWGASFIGRYATGYPYSPVIYDFTIDELPLSGRKPAHFNVDAHLYKDVNVGGLAFRLFGKVYNLFDTLNENFVFDDTGRATYTLTPERLGTALTWQPAYGLPGVPTLDEYYTRPNYYSAPRQVRLGITASF